MTHSDCGRAVVVPWDCGRAVGVPWDCGRTVGVPWDCGRAVVVPIVTDYYALVVTSQIQ